MPKLTGCVERNDMVANLDAGDTFSHGLDDTTTFETRREPFSARSSHQMSLRYLLTFVTQDGGEDTLRVLSGQGVCVGVTDTSAGTFPKSRVRIAKSQSKHRCQ